MEKPAEAEWYDGPPQEAGVYRVRPPISQLRRFSRTPFHAYWNGTTWSPSRKGPPENALDPILLAQAAIVQQKQWRKP